MKSPSRGLLLRNATTCHGEETLLHQSRALSPQAQCIRMNPNELVPKTYTVY